MSRAGVETLVDRWINDPAFRDQMRLNPVEAVRRSGAELDSDELQALQSVDWSLPDEELQARLNAC